MLRRPLALAPRAVVVGPDDLVQEAVAAEQPVEEDLGVVDLAGVEVQVEGPVGSERAPRRFDPRSEEAEIVFVTIRVRETPELLGSVPLTLEPDAIPASSRIVASEIRRCTPPVLNGGSM